MTNGRRISVDRILKQLDQELRNIWLEHEDYFQGSKEDKEQEQMVLYSLVRYNEVYRIRQMIEGMAENPGRPPVVGLATKVEILNQKLAGRSYREIAKDFGISHTAVMKICKGTE